MNEINFIERKYFNKIKNEHYSFNEILQNNISIILGEPASGKTFQLKHFYENNENCEFIELLTLDLETDIIDKDIDIVLIDSIDEALSKTESDKKLKKQLKLFIKACKETNPSVKFIITCRFVEWKEQFENELKILDKELTIFYIEELSEADIEEILNINHIDKDEFWSFINSNYLNEFIKNIMMLLYITKNFPTYKSKEFKYYKIYKAIIEEHLSFKTDNERCEKFDKINLEQRLNIASIIATYMTLNRKREISIEDCDKLTSSLYNLNDIEISGEVLKIVFDTSLFTGELTNTRFFHKSIQEFLTAYFIIQKKLNIETIKTIFAYDTSFYEEFEEVIIHTTNLENDFFKHFVSFDPVVFRRHSYLNENEQKQLLIEMLNIVQFNGHKIWNKWEYLDNSSLVKFPHVKNIALIVSEHCDFTNINYEMFSYLSAILKNNYSMELEDIVFQILESIKTDKRKCIDYISSNHIPNNISFNSRLFEFMQTNQLSAKRDKVSLKIFQSLYNSKSFEEISCLLNYFSTYTDTKIISNIDVNDIASWLDKILATYTRKQGELSPKQVSFLIVLILKNCKKLQNKTILNTIFQSLTDSKIYDINFNISDYEKENYILNFDDIKEDFANFLFKEHSEGANLYNFMRILKFYVITLEDIESLNTNYPIKTFTQQYGYFRKYIDENTYKYLLSQPEFKQYLDEIMQKHEEFNRKWEREERPHRKLIKKREKASEYLYKQSIRNLNTIKDIHRIFFKNFDNFDDKIEKLDNQLKKDLKSKYSLFIQMIKDEFQKDTFYTNYKENLFHQPTYYNTYLYHYLFKILAKEEIDELIINDTDFEKAFMHMYKIHGLHEDTMKYLTNKFIIKFNSLINELFKFSLEQSNYKESILTYHLPYFLQEMNLYNKDFLNEILIEIKSINEDTLISMNSYDRDILIEILSLDEENYIFIKSILDKDIVHSEIYFKYLFAININQAFEDYISMFQLNKDFYLNFQQSSPISIIMNTNQFNKFDILNISPIYRNNFRRLMGIIYYRHENTFSPILEELNDSHIEFILNRYFKLFKEYQHPLGTFSPDIYDDMNSLVNKLFALLGEDKQRLDLLIKLGESPLPLLSKRANYQIDNIKNQLLRNREFNNEYYQTILNNYNYTEKILFDYEKFEKDLYDTSSILLDSRHSIYEEIEDLINDRYRDALIHRGYIVSEQNRGGESQTTKSVGERDISVRNKDTQVIETILEGFILKGFNKNVIDEHYEKLIKKYDTAINKKNYILVYSKVENFDELWEKYKTNFELFTEHQTEKGNIYTGITKHIDMEIVHFFINFYSEKK